MPSKKEQTEKHAPIYTCTWCGTEYPAQTGNFYCTKSMLYKSNGGFSTVCVKCIHAKFKEVENQTQSTRAALIVVCHLLDTYYNEKIFNNMISQNTFNLGKYLNSFNGRQWTGKSFCTNLLQNDFAKAVNFDDNNIPVRETQSDIKNRNYCITQLGYDPFVDNTPEDRLFLFNTLAEYFTDDIVEDPHRLQSVVSLVKSILQEAKFDKLIDTEQKNKMPNTETIKSYIEGKDKIRKLINQTASENGLSVKGSGKSTRGASTLTGIMREMAENNFEDVKVNIFDVKMNGAFKYIADISNQSLCEQLNYQSDDYARMVTTQRELIRQFEDEKLKSDEEIRLLKLELKKLKTIGDDSSGGGSG